MSLILKIFGRGFYEKWGGKVAIDGNLVIVCADFPKRWKSVLEHDVAEIGGYEIKYNKA